MKDKQISIIIPVYNEGDNIKEILPEMIDYCKENNSKIIIVNDGSVDNTDETIRLYSDSKFIKILSHKLNKGYGAAIKTGIKHCDTEYLITFDGDAQHRVSDIDKLKKKLKDTDADMVVGSRRGKIKSSFSKRIGKKIIRMTAKFLMSVPIHDINSGMKIYRSDLAKKYIHLTPDTMAFSDTITLIFINKRHLVLEEPIEIKKRIKGESKVNLESAFKTFMEVINIVFLFSPAKIFLPLSILCFIAGLAIGIPVLIAGNGISTGSLLGIFAGIILFLLGLLAEQLSLIRRNSSNNDD